MSEISRADKYSLVPQIPAEFGAIIKNVVEAMYDTLNTYGKPATPNLLDAWVMVLVLRKILAREIVQAAGHFLQGKDMPKPGEFCDWIIANRENRAQTEALIAGVQMADVETEERRREKNLRLFGTEDPTVEQWSEYLAGTGASAQLDAVLGKSQSGLRKMPTVETPVDEVKILDIRRQIEDLRRGA